jgi:SAM-dependent methyltransferase
MSDAEQVRAEYESSVSWRVTKPLRALKRRARTAVRPAPAGFTPGLYDSWLEHFHGERLAAIDAACAGGGREHLALFRDLDVDLWAMLLSQDYEVYPNIRALLPRVPDPSLQELWNGAHGARLSNQSKTFYTKVGERFAQHADRPLSDARVLDYGCGWGRLIRFFARDVAPGSLHGCDPVQQILDVCRDSGVPAELTKTDFLPERLPYDEPFDLAYSFSVFTHISERAADTCLRALHAALRPGGILVLTVRPPEYLHFNPFMHGARDALGPDPAARMSEPHYLFVPHAAEDSHPQYEGGEMTYGETVITLPYLRERWAGLFEVLEADVLIGDLYQVMITLRRR